MTAGKMAYVEPGLKRPPGAVLAIHFEDDGELVVSERVSRKSVRVRLMTSAELAEDFAHLGPEPLDPSFDDAALAAALARGGQLHSLLRDQRALVGIGRAYANEILHEARLAPFAPADRLTDEERARLLEAIHSTLAEGIERFRPRGPRMIAKGKTPEVYDIHGHAGRGLPALRLAAAERRFRRPPDRLLPVVSDGRADLRRPTALAAAQVAAGKRTVTRSSTATVAPSSPSTRRPA